LNIDDQIRKCREFAGRHQITPDRDAKQGEETQGEIANRARAIAVGNRSSALLDELGKPGRELDGISEELLAADGCGLDARLQEIEGFVQKRLHDIRGLLFADVAGRKPNSRSTAPR